MGRSAKYKGDVEVTHDVTIGGDVYLENGDGVEPVSLRETLFSLERRVDELMQKVGRDDATG